MSQASLIIVSLLAIASVCLAHIGGGEVSQNADDVHFYCGRNLARTLAALCYGLKQDNLLAGKRSEDGGMYNAFIPFYYKDHEPRDKELAWPWLAPHKARSLSLPSRGKRFIVTECCDKPCTLNELMSYC